jgi:hypothetical protein
VDTYSQTRPVAAMSVTRDRRLSQIPNHGVLAVVLAIASSMFGGLGTKSGDKKSATTALADKAEAPRMSSTDRPARSHPVSGF